MLGVINLLFINYLLERRIILKRTSWKLYESLLNKCLNKTFHKLEAITDVISAVEQMIKYLECIRLPTTNLVDKVNNTSVTEKIANFPV